MEYRKKLDRAHEARPGDIWKSVKNERKATILAVYGEGAFAKVRLEHETGRRSMTQLHYFAGNYEPCQE